jgi:mRNA-degrading endonuclease toxin of MazEF toxin-antitoxin module
MKKTKPKISKGDIFILENFNAFGHEQKGFRPHVVVTQITGGTVTIAPCTTSDKIKKYCVKINPDKENKLTQVSYILISQAFASDTSILKNKIGHLNDSDIIKVQLEYVKYVTD